MVQIENKDFVDLLIYAERYALGRQTYCVDDVCKALKRYKKIFTEKDRYVICKDITDSENYGNEYFAKQWESVLKELKEVKE